MLSLHSSSSSFDDFSISFKASLSSSTSGAYNFRTSFNTSTPSSVNANSSNNSEYAIDARFTATFASSKSEVNSSFSISGFSTSIQSCIHNLAVFVNSYYITHYYSPTFNPHHIVVGRRELRIILS